MAFLINPNIDDKLDPKAAEFILGHPYFEEISHYLDGDNYYKTFYSEHNLVRSLVQKKMIEQMEQNVELIKQIIVSYYNH